uniref:UBN2 domain-containing protein n=2 Tax=Nicotiana TaxID=4085 RepID=A0A1S4DL53_TOBAC|nr:PREDICTED: uncharacterized protein LOC104216243 [Nicotiana sylvestris]XP_016514130.1 PREDICTED: uncharacterized protein LOC107830949 [Nicotiana tabacum]
MPSSRSRRACRVREEQPSLGLRDREISYAFAKDKPPGLHKPTKPTTTSTADEKVKYEKWMEANKLSLMIMKRSISDHIKGAIKDNGNAKDFLSAIGQKFLESDKVEIDSLIDSLSTIKYDLVGSVRDHIMKLVNIATKLNNLGVIITDDFLVHQSLRSLPEQFNHLKTTYNAQKD